MAKNEKLKKLDVDETKGVSGGVGIFWADDGGNVRCFVLGREYTDVRDAIEATMGMQEELIIHDELPTVEDARRASNNELIARTRLNERIMDDRGQRRH